MASLRRVRIAVAERPPGASLPPTASRDATGGIDHSEWRLLVNAGLAVVAGDLIKITSDFQRVDEFGVDRIGGRGVSLGRSQAMGTRDGFLQRCGSTAWWPCPRRRRLVCSPFS